MVLQVWVSSVSTLLLSGNKKLPHGRSVTRRHRRRTLAPDGVVDGDIGRRKERFFVMDGHQPRKQKLLHSLEPGRGCVIQYAGRILLLLGRFLSYRNCMVLQCLHIAKYMLFHRFNSWSIIPTTAFLEW